MFGAIAHSTEPATNRLSEVMIMAPAAVDVAQRPEHRRNRGRGEQIGGDDPGQVARRPGTGARWSAARSPRWSGRAPPRNIVSIRLMTMVRTSSCDSGTGGAMDGASSTLMTSLRKRGTALRRYRRATSGCRQKHALPFELVHLDRTACSGATPRKISFYAAQCRQQSLPGQAPRRMGASRQRTIVLA